MSSERMRVLITGADGVIGRFLMDAWRNSGWYEPVGLTRKPGPYCDVMLDITDLDALTEAMREIDAVVHMAATSAVGSTWEQVLPSNLIGTYNVFEAARRAGVRQVVFASSNHTIGTNEKENAPALYDLDDTRVWDHTVEPRPDSLYGVSKLYGEAMARYYVDHHGLHAYCLRIGGVRDAGDPNHPGNLWAAALDGDPAAIETRIRTRAIWLSERDCTQLVERCLDSDLPWVLCYGISDNPRKFWDIEHAKEVLGYEPQDAAPWEIEAARR